MLQRVHGKDYKGMKKLQESNKGEKMKLSVKKLKWDIVAHLKSPEKVFLLIFGRWPEIWKKWTYLV